MRVYAFLFGVVVTIGSASLAQLAVASAGFDRIMTPPAAPRGGDLLGPGELWYGGVIEPITIEAMRAARPAVAVAVHKASTADCVRLAHPRHHARPCDRTSMDSMM
jgi:hypothetical protein